MDMNDSQRSDLAVRIRSERVRQFGGNRRRAYTAAGVNAATWTNAEEGARLAERSVVAIVRALWPETGGDWTALEPPLGDVDPEQEIINAPISQKTKELALRLLTEDRERQSKRRRGAS